MNRLFALFLSSMLLMSSVPSQARDFSIYEDRMLGAYLAYYGRPADPGGLAFWADRLEDEGGDLRRVIDAFGNSEEFKKLFRALSNTELVTSLYDQLFGRGPDPVGLDFYVGKLDSGELNPQSVAFSILDGVLNDDEVIVGNRLKFSRFYVSGAEDGSIGAKAAEELAEIMASVDDSTESVERAFLKVHDADGINGGRLYSRFWADETGFTLENSNLQSQEELDGITFRSDFFRCKQCHGWDRLGREGGYSNRAPNANRPNITNLNLHLVAQSYSAQELFDAIKTGMVTRRDVDIDLSQYDPEVDPTLGDMMPDYSQILTDKQIWDLVAYFKQEAVDTTQLYDIELDAGEYPDRGRTFSNLGRDGNGANGDAIFAANCAECHGTDGTAIPVDGGEYTVGAHLRAKPYEDQHKVKFGNLGTSMGAVLKDSSISDIRDLFKALANSTKYPDEQTQTVDPTATLTFDFVDFTDIVVPSVFNITVVQGEDFLVQVTIDEDVVDRVDVSQNGATLTVNLLLGDSQIDTLQAFVTMPVLRRIDLSGVVLQSVLRDFNQTEMIVNVGGVSQLRGEGLVINDLTATVSGTSELDFGGIAPIGNAEISISGVSRATLNMDVGSTLTASVSTGQGTGISKLFYYGTDVNLNISSDSSSSVERLGETHP